LLHGLGQLVGKSDEGSRRARVDRQLLGDILYLRAKIIILNNEIKIIILKYFWRG
jgi:hypothetical protein